MQRNLYFVCPTDHLETVIENHFLQENYFVTSLGNSVKFNSELVEEINALIETKSITEIHFVLSDTNKIILDAMKSGDFNKISELKRFYEIISAQKKQTEFVWHAFDIRIPMIAYCLNLKVQELSPLVSKWLSGRVKVNAKIYKRKANAFNEINPDLLHLENFNLN